MVFVKRNNFIFIVHNSSICERTFTCQSCSVRINVKIDTKVDKTDVDRLMNRMGEILDQTGDDRAQQFKTQRQVDHHEKWHHQIAEKIGLKLEN